MVMSQNYVEREPFQIMHRECGAQALALGEVVRAMRNKAADTGVAHYYFITTRACFFRRHVQGLSNCAVPARTEVSGRR